MCGRYKLMLEIQDLEASLKAKAVSGMAWTPQAQVFPSQMVPVLRLDAESGAPQLQPMRWGLLPPYEKNPKARGHINARAETMAELRSFKAAFATRRCIIPAEGFYEWEKPSKRRHLFSPRSAQGSSGQAELFALAGLWQSWRGPDQALIDTVTILTTRPNDVVAKVYDRMPVILSHNEMGAWLAADTPPAELHSLLAPSPDREMQDEVEGEGQGSAKENTDRVDQQCVLL